MPVSVGGNGLRSVRFAKRFIRHAGQDFASRFLAYSTYYSGPEVKRLLGLHGGDSSPFIGVEALVNAWHLRDTEDLVDRMTYVDLKYYLPGLGLAYVDKASMAASVEVRVPLLDDRLVDLVARIPGGLKVSGFRTKRAFRGAVRGVVPEVIRKRPKAPFAAPLRSWIANGSLPMLHDLLSPALLRRRGIVDPQLVERMIAEHMQGVEDHSLRLWALLTLEVWIQEFIDVHRGGPEEHGLISAEIEA
jgi:asparagine synthase (glutamine-hydrolysing)